MKQRGADHPVTLLYMSNVAELLEDQDKLADAEQQHREVLAGRRKVLPARHKQIATTVVNLASVLNQHRRFDEAESLARAKGSASMSTRCLRTTGKWHTRRRS